MQALWENPIITRELRARMRGNRAVWLQLAYLSVLGGVLLYAYALATRTPDLLASGELGRRLFEVITVTQAVLICLIAPALSAGAISLEREQQTLDALFSSPMSTSRIFWGKLVSASLFLLLLLTIGLPLLAVTFLLGGVSLADLVGTYAIHVCSALLIAAMGVGWSLNCQSTSAATVATYLSVGAYLMVSAGIADSSRFPEFGAVMPILASEGAGRAASSGTTVWLGSALLTLLAAACLVDISACRARLLRDARAAVRPRLWAASVVLTALLSCWCVGELDFGPREQLVPFLLLGLLAAVLYVTGADEPEARPSVRWWEVWRHGSASGALFALLLGTVPWALCQAGDPHPWLPGLVVLASTVAGACAMALFLQRALGKRWPAQIIAAALVVSWHAVLNGLQSDVLSWHAVLNGLQGERVLPNVSPFEVVRYHQLVPASLLLNGAWILLAWRTRRHK